MIAHMHASHKLLLQAALLQNDNAITAWNQWISTHDIDTVDGASHRLLPLLYKNLIARQVKHKELPRLKGIHRYFWCKNQILMRRLSEILTLFRDHGLKVMVLKGVPLALNYYADIGLRPMADFDVLIPVAQAMQGCDLLLSHEWYVKPEFEGIPNIARLNVNDRHAVGFSNQDGIECDLHWHVLQDCCWDCADDPFWQHAEEGNLDGTKIYFPSPTDLLFHTCIHGAAYNPMASFRWVADAVMILNKRAGEIDWKRMLMMAQSRLLLLPLQNALTELHQLMGMQIPLPIQSTIMAANVSLSERQEFKLRIVDLNYRYTPFGRWCEFSRRYYANGFFQRIMAIPGFMKTIWSVNHLWELPAMILFHVIPAYLERRKNQRNTMSDASSKYPKIYAK